MLPQVAMSAITGLHKVYVLKVMHNGTYAVLEGFQNTDTAVTCSSDAFFLSNDATNYKERTSFLLSAYLSGTPVKISYYSCADNGHIEIGSIQFGGN